MKVGNTYQVTLDDGEILTGKYNGTWTQVEGDGFTLKLNENGDGALVWYDEVESIRPIAYNFTPSDKPHSKLGVGRG